MNLLNDEDGFCDSIVQVDRMLLMALKKNLKVARHLSTASGAGPHKEILAKMLRKHPLVPKEKGAKKPLQAPAETKKRQARIFRYLDALPEDNFETVLELVKSFVRRQKTSEQTASKERSANPGRQKRKGGSESTDKGQSISEAPSASASDEGQA